MIVRNAWFRPNWVREANSEEGSVTRDWAEAWIDAIGYLKCYFNVGYDLIVIFDAINSINVLFCWAWRVTGRKSESINDLFCCAVYQVWLGLTNKGEIIAVKQVELNHSNLDEAEKVQCHVHEVNCLLISNWFML